MTLVDTSVWINFLRQRDPRLRGLLDRRLVLMHPFVLGELLLGGIPPSAIGEFRRLSLAETASDREVVRLIQSRDLAGRGIGYLDAHLVASALLADASLWTEDRRLRSVAEELEIAYLD